MESSFYKTRGTKSIDFFLRLLLVLRLGATIFKGTGSQSYSKGQFLTELDSAEISLTRRHALRVARYRSIFAPVLPLARVVRAYKTHQFHLSFNAHRKTSTRSQPPLPPPPSTARISAVQPVSQRCSRTETLASRLTHSSGGKRPLRSIK